MMNTVSFIYFIILSLAVWRITKMLVDEEGPYSLIERFRNRIINYKWSPIHCFRCTSVWVAFPLTLMFKLPFELFFIFWFASSAVAIFIRDFVEKEK